MAGGLGRKVFGRERLNSADVQGYLMDQAVMRFASASARTAQVPAPVLSMVSLLDTGKRLERHDGTAWRTIAGVPLFSTLALRDAYFTGSNAPVAGDQCYCLGSLMTHDGTAWRFILGAQGTVNTDASALSYIPHGGGQAPRMWVAGAAGSATDGQTVIAKPMQFGMDSVNLIVRYSRTDNSSYYTSQSGLGISWLAIF